MDLQELVRKHTLFNAYKHGGKARLGAVISKIIAEKPELREKIREIMQMVKKEIERVNRMSIEEQEIEIREKWPELLEEKKREEIFDLPDIPGVKVGEFTVRYAPEPSKYAHIGHALNYLINYLYACRYGGKAVLRWDDTNPEKVKHEYYNAIRRDLYWLGIRWDLEVYASDHLPLFYEYAEKLIEKGKAYTCQCPEEKIRKDRAEKRECEHRDKGKREVMEEWLAMLRGEYNQGEIVLRLKGDMSSDNGAMRDPVIFRIKEQEHPIQGSRYKVWPTYDFETAIEEHETGVTHILRSSEFGRMRQELQDYIKDLLGLRKQVIIEYSRFNITGAIIKGRVIRAGIESGKYLGWDDPRLFTLAALRRRGILPEALKELVLRVRFGKGFKNIEPEYLYALNRKIIDARANRYFFVPEPVKLLVEGAPEIEVRLKYHPDIPGRGFRVYKLGGEQTFFVPRGDFEKLEVGDEIRLKDAYNIVIEEKGEVIRARFSGVKVKRIEKVQWVLAQECFKACVLVPEGERLLKVEGMIEEKAREVRWGEVVQFERFGFVRLDDKARWLFIFTHK